MPGARHPWPIGERIDSSWLRVAVSPIRSWRLSQQPRWVRRLAGAKPSLTFDFGRRCRREPPEGERRREILAVCKRSSSDRGPRSASASHVPCMGSVPFVLSGYQSDAPVVVSRCACALNVDSAFALPGPFSPSETRCAPQTCLARAPIERSPLLLRSTPNAPQSLSSRRAGPAQTEVICVSTQVVSQGRARSRRASAAPRPSYFDLFRDPLDQLLGRSATNHWK